MNWKFWEKAPAPAPKNVDGIVAQFNDMIKDLNEVAANKAAEIEVQNEIIREAIAAQAIATTEMNRANTVVGKIQTLIE